MKNKVNREHPFFEKYALLIKSAKKHNGKSIKDISSDTKILTSTLYHYLERLRMPTVTVLEKLADYFGVTTDYLLGREEWQ